MHTVLGIFLKQPCPGRVKTRLAADLGANPAAELYAAFQADLVDRFREFGSRRVLCFSPDHPTSAAFFSDLAGENYGLWPQPPGELGDRLAAFFNEEFAHGAERVVVIGSDSPTLPVDFVGRAFEQLTTHDVVLGPATDGGYYLVGQGRAAHPLFHNVNWSSSRVLEQTIAHVEASRLNLALLSPWYDVDTIDDLDLLRGHIAALRCAGLSEPLKRTEPLLEAIDSIRPSDLEESSSEDLTISGS